VSRRKAAWDRAEQAIVELCKVEHTGPLHGDLCVVFADLQKLRARVGADWSGDPGKDGEATLLLRKGERRVP